MRLLPLSLGLLLAAQTDAALDRHPHPTAIRKMPPDHGAKFHSEYCAFAADDDHHNGGGVLGPKLAPAWEDDDRDVGVAVAASALHSRAVDAPRAEPRRIVIDGENSSVSSTWQGRGGVLPPFAPHLPAFAEGLPAAAFWADEEEGDDAVVEAEGTEKAASPRGDGHSRTARRRLWDFVLRRGAAPALFFSSLLGDAPESGAAAAGIGSPSSSSVSRSAAQQGRTDVQHRDALMRRGWACPTGTSNCSDIGYPDSCCSDGEACVVVTDSGLGSVGCCPDGDVCSGTVSSCATGDVTCSSAEGGGCCIPGYTCAGVGCVVASTTASGSSSGGGGGGGGGAAGVTTLTTTSTSTTVVSAPTPSTVVVTVVVTITTTTSERSVAVTTTSTATRTETASAGSGGSDANPPVRPTSASNTAYCPTGFYACAAAFGGGCCQTGRDCTSASCPPGDGLTTIVSTEGVTVAVPASDVPALSSSAAAAAAAACADGWSSCAADVLGGCCPSRYACGTASCLLTETDDTGGATATASVAKAMSGAASSGWKGLVGGPSAGWAVVAGGLVFTCMIG